MQIREYRLQDVVVVAPVGRIDSTTSGSFEAHLTALSAQDRQRVVIDFAEVDYISSAGLRVMLGLAKRVREQRGALAICSLDNAVRQVFELAGFLPLFAVSDTRDAAVAVVSVR